MFQQGSDLTPIKEHFDEFISGLLTWEPEMKELGVVEPEPVVIAGKTYPEAYTNVNAYFGRNMWRDSLPIVPPTEDLVEWILTGTDRAASDVVGKILPRGGIATVKAVAICLAMAGGRPEYLPLTIACVEAMCHPDLNMQSWGSTTNSTYPVFVVDGPMAKEIRLSCTYGLAGPDSMRPAGAVIGRAIRLVLYTIGGQTPGIGTMSIFGGCRTENLVFAEDYTNLPAGWTTVSEDHGFKRDQNVVTITIASSMVNVLWDFGNVEGNQKALNALGSVMGAPNALKLHGPLVASRCMEEHAIQGCAILPLGFVESLANVSGMSKMDVKNYVWERSKMPYEFFAEECGYKNFIEWRGLYKPGDMIPAAPRPEQIMVAIAGGAQGGHGYWLQPFCTGVATAVEVKLPGNWKSLIEKAETEIGPAPAN